MIHLKAFFVVEPLFFGSTIKSFGRPAFLLLQTTQLAPRIAACVSSPEENNTRPLPSKEAEAGGWRGGVLDEFLGGLSCFMFFFFFFFFPKGVCYLVRHLRRLPLFWDR